MMGFTLKVILILFMINTLLYLGGYRVIADGQNNVIGFIFDLNTINESTNTLNASTVFIGTALQNSTSFNTIGNTINTLFTPIIFGFNLVSFLINIFLTPLSVFNVAGMPFVIKIIVSGAFMITVVAVILSILTGRDL